MATPKQKLDALIPANGASHDGRGANESGRAKNGNGHAGTTALSIVAPAKTATPNGDVDAAAAFSHADEAKARIDEAARRGGGWRGLLRTFQIARVLGMLGFYLFLENYEARAKFNRRMAARRLEEARAAGRAALLREQARDLFSRIVDRLIRLTRFVVFRGADESESKEARLRQQAVRLKTSLIKLGPTFIKIGQSLGTRGDLLPLAYVKELSLLQDQVPPFPTTEAYARIEAELGRSIREAYAEIDAEPVAAASLGQVYRARLHTGEEVAVKVQRPNLPEIINFDIAVLRRI
ncbi:MAG TPA: AarF/UbiB family protein, partial [Pyrinomonadaceae bacterium]|nr:AarF/UbiB family protein [Pyrinomonadaceae bacterium]